MGVGANDDDGLNETDGTIVGGEDDDGIKEMDGTAEGTPRVTSHGISILSGS